MAYNKAKIGQCNKLCSYPLTKLFRCAILCGHAKKADSEFLKKDR